MRHRAHQLRCRYARASAARENTSFRFGFWSRSREYSRRDNVRLLISRHGRSLHPSNLICRASIFARVLMNPSQVTTCLESLHKVDAYVCVCVWAERRLDLLSSRVVKTRETAIRICCSSSIIHRRFPVYTAAISVVYRGEAQENTRFLRARAIYIRDVDENFKSVLLATREITVFNITAFCVNISHVVSLSRGLSRKYYLISRKSPEEKRCVACER